MLRVKIIVLLLITLPVKAAAGADEFEQPPIEYSRSTPENRISELQRRIERKQIALRHEGRQGYLRDLLAKLEIRAESQMLVFSKTSLQRDRISPRTPRAIYFNDDVYVGYCHGGSVIEIGAVDPQLGAVFYTLDQTPDEVPALLRQNDRCLLCHGASKTDGIPAFLVRSAFVGADGLPILSEGSRRVDQTTPIENRWGGWYVTGTHGAQNHLGNFVVSDRHATRPWKNDAGQNVTDLSGRVPTDNYLTPHSDIIALLVFEHQTFVHNLITSANFAARQALHYEVALNRSLGEPENNRLESTTRRIASAGDKLVQGLLFADEAPLKDPIVGSSGYAEQFVELGPRDNRGRSLRDFDLTTRLFKYPCSYLIYSRAFDELPPVMKQYVATRLREILAGGGGKPCAHLSPADRQSIGEILRETKPDLWSVPRE
jgi:hypothetical protein